MYRLFVQCTSGSTVSTYEVLSPWQLTFDYHIWLFMYSLWIIVGFSVRWIFLLDYGKERSVPLNNMTGDGVMQAMEKLVTSQEQ